MKINLFQRIAIACKAFYKALCHPYQALAFLEESQAPSSHSEKNEVDLSHLKLLTLFQHSSRLVDFLKEDLSTFTDPQIGAAARKIHDDCAKSLEELVTIRPIMEEAEGASIKVPAGYDPSRIKVVGKIKGEPPFTGRLVHKGWKAHKRSLPQSASTQQSEIICPAEIEV